jgi:hypothetical protein
MKILGMEIRTLPKVVPHAAEELWVTKDGRRMKIGEMKESHAKHALAMIMRNLRDKKKFATVNSEGKIAFFSTSVILHAVRQLEAERQFVREAHLSGPDAWDWERELDLAMMDFGDQP